MNHQPTRTLYAFLMASLLAFPAISFASKHHRSANPSRTATRNDSVDRHAVQQGYDRAARMRTTLESQPENARKRAEFERVIAAFRSVYRNDPTYTKAPLALQSVAEVYEEMGRRFADTHSFHTSIGAYEFLIKQYPHSSFSRDALLAMGEIYRTDLNDPAQAQKSFRKFIKLYPQAEKASDARTALKEVRSTPARGTEFRGANPPASTFGQVDGNGKSARPGQPLKVTSIRRWVGANYTRIVIGVDGEVGVDASRLAAPDRLVFDLSNARPSPELMGKTFPVEDGFLRQIRVALFKPTVTRIVLDVAQIENYSIFPLPNPFRLVIDIHGSPRELVAKNDAAKPAPDKRAAADADRTQTAENTHQPGKLSRGADASGNADKAHDLSATSNATRESTSAQPTLTADGTEPGGRSKAAKRSKETAALNGESSRPIRTPPPTGAGSRTLTRALGLKIGRIVIDPGHGGHDTGTVGPTGFTEKELVLDVGMRLSRLLEQEAGSEVVMTRQDDTFIPLEERTAVANQKAADLFISIHANASRDAQARGIETYYLNFSSNPEALEVAARENATSQESVHELRDLIKKIALTEKIEESREFASQVQHEVHERVGKAGGKQRDRGVKKAPFVVLIGANMPSVLAEISFLTNPKDERMLKQPEYRQKIAQALYQGILHYVNNLGGVRVAQQIRSTQRAVGVEARVHTAPHELSSANSSDF